MKHPLAYSVLFLFGLGILAAVGVILGGLLVFAHLVSMVLMDMQS